MPQLSVATMRDLSTVVTVVSAAAQVPAESLASVSGAAMQAYVSAPAGSTHDQRIAIAKTAAEAVVAHVRTDKVPGAQPTAPPGTTPARVTVGPLGATVS